MLWASQEIFVDGSAEMSVTLSLQPVPNVAGRIEFVGASKPPDLRRVRVGLSPTSIWQWKMLPVENVDAVGEFKITDAVPGSYFGTVLDLPEWVPKSFEIAGRDILDFPIEISGQSLSGAVLTMAPRLATLSGVLQSASGIGVSGFTLVVAPQDPRYWIPNARRIRAIRPSTDGSFSFRDLPAGTYRLAAVEDVDHEQWFDPEFLRQLVPASIPVTLGELEDRIQHVRIK
jgi:hypothetical protein